MTYIGHVQNGTIVLDDPAALPEGMKVRVEPTPENDAGNSTAERPSLLERMKDLVGIIDDLPPDFSENHDHYLYGTPKRSP